MSKQYKVSETGSYTFNKCNQCNKIYFDVNYKCCSKYNLNYNIKKTENNESKHTWKNCTNIKCDRESCCIMWKYKIK